MRIKKFNHILILFLIIFQSVFSQVKLPCLLSDGIVLQRDTNIRIWGWATPNEKLTVEINNNIVTTAADQKGDWQVELPPMNAGGPYILKINSGNHIQVKNVLIGDVWLCSGQSNMVLTMKRVSPLYENVIAQSENSSIRYFKVPDRYHFNKPLSDLESGKWESANPSTVLNFSAVAYFFARALFEKYRVPIGLINASLGGSPAEAWMSEEALKCFPVYYNEAQRFKDSTLINEIQSNDRDIRNAWYNRLKQLDRGYKDKAGPWYDPGYDVSGWSTMELPGYWADGELGAVNGVVWFRKEIDIPEAMTGNPAKLILGRIVDSDSVFFNGVFVGATGYQYPPRRYKVPVTLLKAGINVIVIRVISNMGRGGFVPDKPYQLCTKEGIIDLKGKWQCRLGAVMNPLPEQTFIRWKPMGLYNGMIAPLINYKIKGVIWYQGESNAGKPEEYRKLFPALIADWRQRWQQGNFPFLFVQLPNFMEAKADPSESHWALLREAQFKTLDIPGTGMAVTIDLGEWNDIHPLNKRDVGERLALAAQKIAYGNEDIVCSGPIYKSMKIEDNKIIITFSGIGSGLTVQGGGDLRYFAIAGKDKKFVWAKAKIVDNKVIVWHDNIRYPVAVRYAWADNPEGANLYNKEGLPASPFRTDDF